MQVLSTLLPSELHNSNGSSPCPPTIGSGTLSDPASSLREAALLTLKSKRRKPNLGLSHRPVSDDTSFRLDYGQAFETASPAVQLATTIPSVSAPEIWEVEDGQIREEGEISDTEGTPPVTTTQPSLYLELEPTSDSAATFSPAKPEASANANFGSPPRHNSNEALLSPASAEPCEPTSIMRSYDFPVIDSSSSSYVLEIDEVRPGLTMTQAQFATAKDLVLDLLGWGVRPEYLVEFGLSREIIYYAFRELSLRFPTNLDINGLIPFPPAPDLLSISGSSHLQYPVPQPTPVQSEMDLTGALPHGSGLPAKPPKFARQKSISVVPLPSTIEGLATSSTLLPTSTVSVSTPSPIITSPSLHDMEQQRRQELMARKAVQASRKPKPSSDESSPSRISGSCAEPKDQGDQDIEMASHVLEGSVDDFLNSIGSVPFVDNGNRNDANGVPPYSNLSPVDMDVDMAIPGAVTPPAPVPSTTPPRSPSSVRSSLTSIYTNSVSSTDQTPDQTPPSTSTEPLASHPHAYANSAVLILSHPREPGNIKGSNGPTSSSSRRGTKRPVAADFVDVDPGPSRQHPGNGYVNGRLNRKTGSFASVSGMRRCVIDLSDSDDDRALDEMRSDKGAAADHERGWGEPSHSTSTAIVPDTGGVTPNIHSSGDAGTMSPAALMAKEQEIRKMRELIAQREQNRLKKLATSSRPTSAANQHSSSPSAAGLQPLTQEEEDSVDLRVTSFRECHTPHNVEKDIAMRAPTCEAPQSSTSVILTTDLAASSRSTSAPATPSIDDSVPNVIHHLDLGEEALMAEIIREQVASDGSRPAAKNQWQQDTGFDIDQASPSSATSRLEKGVESRFTTYNSPFEWYPLLRSHSRPVLAGGDASESWHSYSTAFPSSFSVLFPLLSLKMLKLATIANLLDPSKRICHYEVPGGGVCRDEECEDVHPSRVVGIDPNDKDTAQYVHNTLPEDWQGWCSVRSIEEVLGGVRQRNSVEGKTTMDLEARVAQALFILGQGHT